MSDMKLAVMGAAGKMGRELVRTIHAMEGCVVAGAVEAAGSAYIGQDAGTLAGVGELGVLVSGDALDVIAKVDGVLDFTVPAASVEIAGLSANARIVHVMGTTGHTEEQLAAVRAAARHATIIKAGNMSLGVNLLVAVTKKVAEALDADFDIEVLEMHHRHKIDAPSGTALMLGQAAAEGRHIPLKGNSVMSREGHTGARKRGDIGFATLRGGNVVGEHSVLFAADGERIVLSHIATDRGIFARGAVKAAMWGRGKGPGLFSMADVLGM
ncbi:MAG: 4-hydroxy-tetrahydrodipicolinate reductase [Hyphomicrobiaceae bacterium]